MNDNEKLERGRQLVAEMAVWFLAGGADVPAGWAEKAEDLMRYGCPSASPALLLVAADELLAVACETIADAETAPNGTWYRRLFEMDGSHMALVAGIDDNPVWIPAAEVEIARKDADPEEFRVIDEVNAPSLPANTEAGA